MKYTVKMSCGHEEQIELFGPGTEREKKIQYYQTSGLCKECYRKQVEEREKENIHGFLDIDSFPPLVGSEKQVKWANDIRKEAIINVNVMIKSRKEPEDVAAYEEMGRSLKKVFDVLTDAGQIINKRYSVAPSALKEAAEKIKRNNAKNQ